MAQEILTTLKEHPDAWTRVDTILEFSQNQQTKYYALQILENVIKTRWKVLPRPQCEGNRNFYHLHMLSELSCTGIFICPLLSVLHGVIRLGLIIDEFHVQFMITSCL